MRLSFGMKPDRNLPDRQRDERLLNRRVFLKSGIIFSGAALAGAGLRGADTAKKRDEKEPEVGPPEDLMREHGVLKRVLLIYGEALRRLDAKQDFRPRLWPTPPASFADLSKIITRSSRKIFSSRASKKPISSWT